jgi:hypothetical protein
MGGNWARTGHRLGPSTGGLGPGKGHDTGRLGTGGLGTDWARTGHEQAGHSRIMSKHHGHGWTRHMRARHG